MKRLAIGLAAVATVAMSGDFAAAEKVDGREIRIVASDAPVQSRKRGVCANELSGDDIKALSPGVSWYYNWHYAPPSGTPTDLKNFEFLPMAWGDRPEDLAGLKKYLAAGHKPRYVLALNEPNLKGQAFITPKRTAEVYQEIRKIADAHKIPVIGPHMALGSGEDASIGADDPIEKKKVTYTYMVPFLKAFLHYVGKTEIPAVALHAYGDINELRWAVAEMHKQFDRPVWMTEYAQWNAPTLEAAREYLILSTDFMERSSFVEGYAWFKERANDNDKISLLSPNKSGELTMLGEAYVNLPVHDADLYYRLPGKLAAERYVTMSNMEIASGSEEGSRFQMTATGANATIDYNVFIEQAGEYTMKLRGGMRGGKIGVWRDGSELATVLLEGKPWQTVETKLKLDAGAQTLRLNVQRSGQTLGWIELTK